MITDLLSSTLLGSSQSTSTPSSSAKAHRGRQASGNHFPSDVTYAGYLYRLTNKVLYKSWIKRYVELQDNVIIYYDSKKATVLGRIVLNSQIIFEDSLLRHFCFCLTDIRNSMTHYFAAETIVDKDTWTEKIRIAILQVKLSSQRARSQIVHSTTLRNHHQNEARKEYQNRPQLYVKVVKARNLFDKDTSGKGFPFVNVCIGSSTVRTTAYKHASDPEWGMVFTFDMHRSYRYAKVELWATDSKSSSSDEFLGVALIPLLPLRDGNSFRSWYPLNKRSSKSSVRGEVEVEISCSGDPDRNHYSWHFFRCIRQLPELRSNLLSPTSFSNDNDHSNPIDENNLSTEGFPFYYPPIQTEILEDLSIRVQLSCTSYDTKVSVQGIMLLTNYRIIFVTLSRILSHMQASSTSLYNGLDRSMTDLTTQVPLGCITSVSFTTETESNNTNVHDVIRIKTIDHRNLSFHLCDDLEYQLAPWSPNGSTETFSIVNKNSTYISSFSGKQNRSYTNDWTSSSAEIAVSIRPFNEDVNSSFHNEDDEEQISTIENESENIIPRASNDNGEPSLRPKLTGLSLPLSRPPGVASNAAIEKAWLNLISEASYIVDNADADEGSPFDRIFNRLNLMVSSL
jgi:hypothetical protein